MSTAYIERGSESSPTSEQVFSFSAWVKLGDGGAVSGRDMIFCQTRDGVTTDFLAFYIKETTRALHLECNSGSSTIIHLVTTQFFKDPAGWYNLAFNINMADSTTDDRAQIFVNGTRVTELDTNTIGATQNINCMDDNASNRTRIGAGDTGNTGVAYYYDGSMSHVHFVDGVAYAGSNWGSTDSTSGMWKIDPEPTVSSYGNRGFWLKMEDRTNLDLDSSPNATTLTTSGTLTATYDNPSNSFATINPLDNFRMNGTLTYGNTRVATTSAEYGYITATYGVGASKWYWEMKCEDPVDTTNYLVTGIAGKHDYGPDALGYDLDGVAYQAYDGQSRKDGTITAYGDSWTTDDIIGIAMDLDNSKLYFSKNGVWQNSGDPTSGATGTGAISITAVASTTAGVYFPAFSDYAGSSWTNAIVQYNFGNGYFASALIADPEADDAGIGAFKYDVPAGYYTLCTKNIKAYGG